MAPDVRTGYAEPSAAYQPRTNPPVTSQSQRESSTTSLSQDGPASPSESHNTAAPTNSRPSGSVAPTVNPDFPSRVSPQDKKTPWDEAYDLVKEQIKTIPDTDVVARSRERTSSVAVLAWVAACYASKVLRHPSPDTQAVCSGIIYVVSRMEWYDRLQNLFTENEKDYSVYPQFMKRTTNLYAAILLYLMKVATLHPLEVETSMFTNELSVDSVKDAESALVDFNEEQVNYPLQKLFQAALLGESIVSTTVKTQSEVLGDLLSILHVTDSKSQHMANSYPAEGEITKEIYDSLQKRVEYVNFLDGGNQRNRLLWITGEHGQGKTRLLHSVVQGLDQRSDPLQVAFFFFDHGNPESDNAAAALGYLIALIITRNPTLEKHLRAKLNSTGRKRFNHLNDFLALSVLFFDIIMDPEFAETYIIVDSLHECNYLRADFIDLIVRSLSECNGIRWLVSSTPDILNFGAGTPRWQHLPLGPHMRVSYTTIESHIKYTVSTLAKDKSYYRELTKMITNSLCELKIVNFLWIDIVCGALLSKEIWHAEDFVDRVKTKRDLQNLYSLLLDEIKSQREDKDLCIDVLLTMGVAHQSVDLRELKRLMNWPPRVDIRVMLRHCSGFLQVCGDTVLFRLESAKVYVLDVTRNTELVMEVRLFLGQCFLNWVDALSLGDEMSLVITRLWEAETLLQEMRRRSNNQGNSDLVDAIQDAHSFLRFHESTHSPNGGAWDTAVFCPKTSIIRSLVVSRGHPWLSKIPEMDQAWSSNLSTFYGHKDQVLNISISSDAQIIASGSNNGMVRIWDTKTGTMQNTFKAGGRSYVYHVALSADIVAAGPDDRPVMLWDITIGRKIRQLPPCTLGASAVCLSPDGRKVAVAVGRKVYVWAIKEELPREPRVCDIHATALNFIQDDELLITTLDIIQLWNINSLEVRRRFTSQTNGFTCAALSSCNSGGGRIIASGSENGAICNWKFDADIDLSGNIPTSIVQQLDEEKEPGGSEKRTRFGGGKEKEIPIVTSCMGFNHDDLRSLDFSPNNGNELLSASDDGTVRICATKTGKLIHVLEGHTDWVRCAAWSSTAKYVATGSDDGSIRVWKVGAEKEPKPVAIIEKAHNGSYVMAVAFSTDGKYLVSGGTDRNVVIWEQVNSEEWKLKHKPLEGHTDSVYSILVTPDSKYVLSASRDGTLRKWDLENGGEQLPPVNIDWVDFKMWWDPSGIPKDETPNYVMTPQGAWLHALPSTTPGHQTMSHWRVRYDKKTETWWVSRKGRDVILIPRKYSAIPTSKSYCTQISPQQIFKTKYLSPGQPVLLNPDLIIWPPLWQEPPVFHLPRVSSRIVPPLPKTYAVLIQGIDGQTSPQLVEAHQATFLDAALTIAFEYNPFMIAGEQATEETSSQVARELLDSVEKKIETWEDDLSIIFFAYDLGGVVLKQAFANISTKSQYQRILDRTSLVVFYGTPHQSSGSQNWAVSVLRILHLCYKGLLGPWVPTYIEWISQYQQNLDQKFRALKPSFRVMNICQKSLSINYEFITDPLCAILGIFDEETVLLERSHYQLGYIIGHSQREFMEGRMRDAVICHWGYYRAFVGMLRLVSQQNFCSPIPDRPLQKLLLKLFLDDPKSTQWEKTSPLGTIRLILGDGMSAEDLYTVFAQHVSARIGGDATIILRLGPEHHYKELSTLGQVYAALCIQFLEQRPSLILWIRHLYANLRDAVLGVDNKWKLRILTRCLKTLLLTPRRGVTYCLIHHTSDIPREDAIAQILSTTKESEIPFRILVSTPAMAGVPTTFESWDCVDLSSTVGLPNGTTTRVRESLLGTSNALVLNEPARSPGTVLSRYIDDDMAWALRTTAWIVYAVRPLSRLEVEQISELICTEEASLPVGMQHGNALFRILEYSLSGFLHVSEGAVCACPELESGLRSVWAKCALALDPELYVAQQCFSIAASLFQGNNPGTASYLASATPDTAMPGVLGQDGNHSPVTAVNTYGDLAQPLTHLYGPAIKEYATRFWIQHQHSLTSRMDEASDYSRGNLDTHPLFDRNAWVRHLISSNWSKDTETIWGPKVQPEFMEQAYQLSPFDACYISFRLATLPLAPEDDFEWLFLSISGEYLPEDAYIRLIMNVVGQLSNTSRDSMLQRIIGTATPDLRSKLLAEYYCDFFQKNFLEILLTAIATGNNIAVTEMLNQGSNLMLGHSSKQKECSEHRLGTALQVACEYGDINIVQSLLSVKGKESPSELEMLYHWSALHVACHQGHSDIVEAFINQLTNPTIQQLIRGQYCLLLVTSAHGLFTISKLLKEFKIQVPASEESTSSPIQLAAKYGFPQTLKSLIDDHDCKLVLKNQKNNILSLSVESGNEDVMRQVKKAFSLAIRAAHTEYVPSESPMDSNDSDSDGYMSPWDGDIREAKGIQGDALFTAVECGGVPLIMEFLFWSKHDFKVKDPRGRTPLMVASRMGCINLSRALFVKGDEQSASMKTALHYACFHGHLQVVEFLIGTKKFSLTIRDEQSLTPMMAAAIGGHLQIVKVLVSQLSDKDLKNEFLKAARFGQETVMDIILKAAVGMDRKARDGFIKASGQGHNTLLHFAAAKGHTRVVEFLLRRQPNLEN
ncbi:hypothetical protein GQX73_g9295 [Xylaria multiplex]|uniref:NACHT domain-containing protein n=1 Tax=Xylaria multiplex TaxID=323545 RepID=A0A7C8IL67_9PEZI|nr:hypothetical protein GQX73_g9295 [Xylaria multiplex]